MPTRIATLALAAFAVGLVAPAMSVASTPTRVDVRIEGKSETLFEGPILAEGHSVRASSDTKQRSCDGINPLDPENLTAAPTPTSVSADAMGLIGETFDGRWYPEYDDYFITRWGPDAQSVAEGAYWGILVNDVFTNVGGCQYELDDGDEVLWAYDAFAGSPSLALYPAGYASGERPLVATAVLGEPFEVEVLEYSDQTEGNPPASPGRAGSTPIQGADVSPVSTSTEGFEKVETDDPATVTSDAQGKATLTFTEPGWHRIKATVVSAGHEGAIRSNRLDVCVPAEGSTSCPDAPTEDQPRIPPAPPQPEDEAKEKDPGASKEPAPDPRSGGEQAPTGGAATVPKNGSTVNGSLEPEALRLEFPRLDHRGVDRGLIGISWRVLSTKMGVRKWTIDARKLDGSGAGYSIRARGTTGASALLRLPAGFLYQLRIVATDVLGRTTTATFAKALVPRDERAEGVRLTGQWHSVALPGAWLSTVSRGTAGARAAVRLATGRPVFLLRAMSHTAKVEVLSGSHREMFAVSAGQRGSPRSITAAARSHPGIVRLRVVSGAIYLDGVAVEP